MASKGNPRQLHFIILTALRLATDKKIKTGGIYYMLSRSLGLPMGGSIGISLFIATALKLKSTCSFKISN